MNPRRFLTHRRAIILLVAGFEFLTRLGSPDITSPHEGRVAATAREMLLSDDWVVPRLGSDVRLAKPPLPYWTAAVLWRLSGSFDVAWARLVPALCGVLGVLLVMDLARRLFGDAAADVSGIIWVSTRFIVEEHRKAMADPYLAALVLLAAWAWVAADDALGEARRRSGAAHACLFWLALALGGLAKGPVVLIHAAFFVCAYHGAGGRWPRPTWGHAIGILVFAIVALPWPLAVIQRVPGALDLWATESVGQMTSERNPRTWWYYLPQLPYVLLPWTALLLPVGALMARGPPELRRRLAFPVLWVSLGILFFSISKTKKDAYLLPLLSPCVLLLGAGVAHFLEFDPARNPRWFGRLLIAHVAAGFLGAGAMLGLYLWLDRGSGGGPRWVWAAPLAVTTSAAAVAVWSLRRVRRSTRSIFLAAAVLAAACVHLNVAWIDPARRAADSPRPFAEAVRAAVRDGPLHSVEKLGEAFLFYLGRPVVIHLRFEELPAGYRGFVIARGSADLEAHGFTVVVEDARKAGEDGGPGLVLAWRAAP